MKFINWDNKEWELDKVAEIINKVKDYCDKKGIKASLYEVEDQSSNPGEKNERFDVEIRYFNEKNILIQQKLLILNGEVVDGKEFHKRFNEFYPTSERKNIRNKGEKIWKKS